MREKATLLRVDLNSPVIRGKVQLNPRIQRHAQTIQQLREQGHKLVVLSHQGRPGSRDFISLEQHAQLLNEYTQIEFIDDIIGPAARNAIQKLEPGGALLLENVRFLAEESLELPPEQHAKSIMVTKLAQLAELYINDAFSVSHRSHASVVGFPQILPSQPGPQLKSELESLTKLQAMEPTIYLLGGAKPEDSFKIIQHLKRTRGAYYVLTTGVIANLFLRVRGKKVDISGYEKFLDWAKQIDHGNIFVPTQVAIEEKGLRKEIDVDKLKENRVLDLGREALDNYSQLISEAKSVVLNGPAGVYERPEFSLGTRQLFEMLANSGKYTVLGGGDTLTALEQFGFKFDQFSFVSLSGGAMLEYLAGEQLPGLKALGI